FVSKKTGRKFEAFLRLKDGVTSFEFPPRERKSKAKDAGPKEPPVKLDFTGQTPVGVCPKCGGKVFESETSYLCEKSQSEKKPCKFNIKKVIAQQPIDRTQAAKLIGEQRTDLLDKFISKAGK